jgi:hypothetical protein
MANAAAAPSVDSDSDDDYCGGPVKQDIGDQIVQVYFSILISIPQQAFI